MKLINKLSSEYEWDTGMLEHRKALELAYEAGFREALKVAIIRLCRVNNDDSAAGLVHAILEEEST